MRKIPRIKTKEPISLKTTSKRMIKVITSHDAAQIYNILKTWEKESKNEDPWIKNHFKRNLELIEKYLCEISEGEIANKL